MKITEQDAKFIFQEDIELCSFKVDEFIETTEWDDHGKY